VATFIASRWVGNHWPSIEAEPVDERLLMPILTWLCAAYQLPFPELTHLLDVAMADFAIQGTPVAFHLDNWSLSLAFESEALRDEVLARLQALPPGYFPI
jgi:hypothetical protein